MVFIVTPLRDPSITNSTPCAVNVLASLRRVERRASVLPCSIGFDGPLGNTGHDGQFSARPAEETPRSADLLRRQHPVHLELIAVQIG